jgi:sulfatase maturation enzyme AslB (radical SAM superfamily)
MINYNEIKHCEIELSSYCNAVCPLCPRNLFGYKYNTGYTERNLTLAEIKKIFDINFINQLSSVTFEGNYGDPLMNPALLSIVEFFKEKRINIYTNGSLQTQDFWKELASSPKLTVYFALDGLEDTHNIYRQNTDFNKIINNASTFIKAGGNAVWKMIKFNHNSHQIKDAKALSKELGFAKFMLADHGRDVGPVFDNDGNLIRVLGDFDGSTELSHYLDTIENGDIFIEDIYDAPSTGVSCEAINKESIYVSSEGDVYPCCYMGFNPKKYGKGRWHQPVNKQIQELLKPNNALERPLEQCIDWFNNIPPCWDKTTFEDGRLIVCDSACGIKTA